MKRTLLFVTLLAFVLSGIAQTKALLPKAQTDRAVKIEYTQPLDGSEIDDATIQGPVKSATFFEENEIGDTWYDLQSNRTIGNRNYLFSDGTIASTWTRGNEVSTWGDRGAGYNYFDGSSWGPAPTDRVETVKSGWPAYAPLGEGGEIIISHNAVDALLVNTRSEKGTGTWTETMLQGPAGFEKVTWPRVATSGENNEIVHVLGIIREYPIAGDLTLAYYRSTDGAQTWDIMNHEIEGTGHDYYTDLGADSYVFAEPRAGVVAFLCVNLWNDLFMMKSMDDGDTWEKTIIWEHPYPMWDWDTSITTDTIWAPDQSAHIALDADGMAHVVFGIARVTHDEPGTTYSYFPYTDGIGYWNETMPAFEYENQHRALDAWEVLEENINLIGWLQDVDGTGDIELTEEILAYRSLGLLSMPQIVIDEMNQIFVSWAGTTETFDNGTYNFKHIWVRTSPDNGTTWGDFHDMDAELIHIFDECIYPVMTPGTTGDVYLMYNIDGTPGLGLDDDHDFEQNRQTFLTISKDEILGVNDPVHFNATHVSQNTPNPFNETSVVMIEVNASTEISLEIHNIMGQIVYQTPARKVNNGTHQFHINGSQLDSGIYFYTVTAGRDKVTKKMIVE